jgi:hypothetical protein
MDHRQCWEKYNDLTALVNEIEAITLDDLTGTDSPASAAEKMRECVIGVIDTKRQAIIEEMNVQQT